MSAWLWTLLGNPLWAACTVLLAFVVRVQRRGPWDPRACKVDLRGKTAIVTGANTGIGYFVALDLARRGARVILACRDLVKARAAQEKIRVQTGNNQVLVRVLDVSDMESVREFARKINEEEAKLHILVNNAGVSGLPQKMTSDGFDLMFATNCLGPFLLTNLLQELLKRSAPSRIVILSSSQHRKGEVDFRHFRGENLVYHSDRVYNHTKLHNVLWSRELANRLTGTGVIVNSVHPGIVLTDVLRHYRLRIRAVFQIIGVFFFKSAEEGAVAPLYCSVSEEMDGVSGKYIDSDCSITLPSTVAQDQDLGRQGFDICLKLTSNL